MHYVLLFSLLLLIGCGGSSEPASETPTKVGLGEQLFFDTNLSLNRTQACATCHNPDSAFTDDRDNSVGGAVSLGDDNVSLGERNTPTAMYAQFAPDFHYDTESGEPMGGQFLDGRETDLKGQAGGPPVNALEMGMPDIASVVARLMENAEYVSSFETLYGASVFDDVNTTYAAMTESIAKFEKTEQFSPFSSKYDRFVQCKDEGNRTAQCYEGEWSLQEQLGLELFFSEANTNCAVCHQLQSQSEVAGETFTNYEYHNIGVPRNLTLLAGNPDLGDDYIDHGLLGRDDVNDTDHDGKFKVPTLRNVAVTAPYMHNGVFKDLRTVILFYDHFVTQSTHTINPETNATWREPEVNATVNREDLTGVPVLTDEKVDALVAFLKTLTDAEFEHLLEE